MKRIYRFVEPDGTAACTVDGRHVELPVFAGVLKHPTLDQLRTLLTDPVVAGKYTREALRRLPWPALRKFPRDWLVACLAEADLTDSRRRALAFMLEV